MTNVTKKKCGRSALHGQAVAGGGEQPKRFFASTDGLDMPDRAAYWSDLNQPNFSMRKVNGGVEEFDASIECWRSGNVTFADMRFLSKDRQPYLIDIGRRETQMLVVRAFRKSDKRGLLDDEPINFSSGEVHIYPYGKASQFVASELELVTAYIPFEKIGYDPSTCSSHIALGAGSPLAHVIKAALFSVLSGLKTTKAGDVSAAYDAFSALVRGVTNNTSATCGSREVFERARGMALRSYIKQNVCDPDLDVRKVCGAFGASRATIYREFEGDGGIARYILRHRLQKAMLDLSSSIGKRGTIAEIAHRYCFSDPSSFSRAFRQHFGVAPSYYLGQLNENFSLPPRKIGGLYKEGQPRIRSWICAD